MPSWAPSAKSIYTPLPLSASVSSVFGGKAVAKETNVCQARVACWGQRWGSSHKTCDVILNLTLWHRTTGQFAHFPAENQLQDEFPAHPRKMQMFWLQLCAQARRFILQQQAGAPSYRILPLSNLGILHDHPWYFVHLCTVSPHYGFW